MNCPRTGNRVVERINRPLQQLLLAASASAADDDDDVTLSDVDDDDDEVLTQFCLLYTSPSPRDRQKSRMPSSA